MKLNIHNSPIRLNYHTCTTPLWCIVHHSHHNPLSAVNLDTDWQQSNQLNINECLDMWMRKAMKLLNPLCIVFSRLTSSELLKFCRWWCIWSFYESLVGFRNFELKWKHTRILADNVLFFIFVLIGLLLISG